MYPQKILWTKQRQLSQTWEHFLQKIRKILAHFQKKTIQSINFSKKLWLLKKFHQTRWKKFWRRTWKTFIKILNIVWSKAENIHPKKTLQKNPKKFLFFQKEIKQRRQNVFVRSPNSCSSLKLIAKNLKHVPKLLETSPRLVEGKFDKPRGRFFFQKKCFLIKFWNYWNIQLLCQEEVSFPPYISSAYVKFKFGNSDVKYLPTIKKFLLDFRNQTSHNILFATKPILLRKNCVDT